MATVKKQEKKIKKAQTGITKEKNYTKAQMDSTWAAQEKMQTSKPKISPQQNQEVWNKKEKEETRKNAGKKNVILFKQGGRINKSLRKWKC